MKIKIEVKEKHIRNGKEGDTASCPIALACIDAGFIEPDISANRMTVTCQTSGKEYRINPVPKKATNFVEAFDDERTVHPFSFVAHLVEKEWV